MQRGRVWRIIVRGWVTAGRAIRRRPDQEGKLFPFLFVTIACGAISGFHALVASGATPKMINKESDARMIGYGAMLMEGVVGIIALIAACSLEMGDYFAINFSPEKFAAVAPLHGFSVVNLAELSREVGENVVGRTGGAVSLAVGFAQIFTAMPGMKALMWSGRLRGSSNRTWLETKTPSAEIQLRALHLIGTRLTGRQVSLVRNNRQKAIRLWLEEYLLPDQVAQSFDVVELKEF